MINAKIFCYQHFRVLRKTVRGVYLALKRFDCKYLANDTSGSTVEAVQN